MGGGACDDIAASHRICSVRSERCAFVLNFLLRLRYGHSVECR
jgi:hypothetical protein